MSELIGGSGSKAQHAVVVFYITNAYWESSKANKRNVVHRIILQRLSKVLSVSTVSSFFFRITSFVFLDTFVILLTYETNLTIQIIFTQKNWLGVFDGPLRRKKNK